MPKDNYRALGDSISAPSRNCFAIIPDDVQDLPEVPKAIYVGSGGRITLRSVDGASDVVFAGIASGTILPVRATAIRATGTDASDLLGLA